MKISQLCKMIEDSIHGNYQLEDQQKDFIDSVQVNGIIFTSAICRASSNSFLTDLSTLAAINILRLCHMVTKDKILPFKVIRECNEAKFALFRDLQ